MIVWTEPAVSDLEAIRDYIKRDSLVYADRFVENVIETVEKLNSFPRMGRVVPEAEDESIREVLLYNYRIIYKVEKSQILILALIHGVRDLTNKINKPWKS
ncbi:addiction module RelE/StbE family toxin [Desulfitispora alkaliphila]|uniref:type II toxin-antitoxin system RelE/ParE family toxin n=1 Tax=Desulfitispora alkaliphila TaxID=622674 RepID=UPI003D1B5EDE